MKKNLFVLMLSAFVLTNTQQSYAMEVYENENNSSHPQTREKRWTPQAPMKPELRAQLDADIKKNPSKHAGWKIEGNEVWRLQ